MSAFVVVNPRSAGGRTRRDWHALERELASIFPHMSVAFTRYRGETVALVAAALREGHSEIVAVGGGGTINEAVNGFFDAEGAVSPDAVLSFVPSGTDCAYCQALGGTDMRSIMHLKTGHIRPIDIGRVSFLTRDGLPRIRYFAGIASFGLTGALAEAAEGGLPGKLLGGLIARWRYRGRMVRLIVDSAYDEITDIATVAVANGNIFSKEKNAEPDGEQFDVVIVANGPGAWRLADLKGLSAGEHRDHPAVCLLRGSKVVAAPVAETCGRAVPLETDGESAGQLPATFEILPRALNVRC